jgi:hypothetical protein
MPEVLGSQARGPAGTEVMGVSIAIPLKEAQHDDGRPWSEGDWQDFIRHAQPEMLDKLRRHVGGGLPTTEPALQVDGPHPDPIQGPVYVMTVSAWFYPHSLPADCTAYQAWQGERRG